MTASLVTGVPVALEAMGRACERVSRGGVGMSLFFAPAANVVLASVRRDQEGIASGANNAIRELGGVFGIAILGAVFSAHGSYATGQTFSSGLKPAVWVRSAAVAVAAGVALLLPSPLTPLARATTATDDALVRNTICGSKPR